MAPPIDRALQLGFRFDPTPAMAVTYFLPRLIAGEPMHVAIRPFVHTADIYACEPAVLAARFRPTPITGVRYFFTSCKLQPKKEGKDTRAVRAAGPGSWNTQTSSADVKDDAGVKVGEFKKFRYRKGGKSTDWLMDEFSSCSEGSVVGGRQFVLCKIYVSPRASANSAARQESDAAAATFALPPLLQEPVAAHRRPAPPPQLEEPVAAHRRPAPPSTLEKPVAAHKRPAPPIAEPPCPKRMRGVVIPTSPMVQPPSSRSSRLSVPHRHMVTDRPASALAPAIAPIHHVVRACHMPVQAPAPRRHPPHQPSIQASTAAPEPCTTTVQAPAPQFWSPPPSVQTSMVAPAPQYWPPPPSVQTPMVAPAQQYWPPPPFVQTCMVAPTPQYWPPPPSVQTPMAAPAPQYWQPPPSVQTSMVAPAPQYWPPPPSVQTPMVALAPCSPVAARDPFCTESPAPAAAQQDDDFVRKLEGHLDQAGDEATAEANDDDTDWFAPMMNEEPSVQTTMVAPAPCSPVAARDPFCTESPDPAAAQQDDDFIKKLEGHLDQAGEEATAEANDDYTDWFGPMMNE